MLRALVGNGCFSCAYSTENLRKVTDTVNARDRSLHIHVMDQSQSSMWHQPMRPLRDWYQEELIVQVQEAAQEAGCHQALLYDAEETLLWQSAGPAA